MISRRKKKKMRWKWRTRLPWQNLLGAPCLSVSLVFLSISSQSSQSCTITTFPRQHSLCLTLRHEVSSCSYSFQVLNTNIPRFHSGIVSKPLSAISYISDLFPLQRGSPIRTTEYQDARNLAWPGRVQQAVVCLHWQSISPPSKLPY